MNEWNDLAELLVELDLAIEDLDSWATRPEDIDELRRQEALRDEIQFALRLHHIPRSLRQRLETRGSVAVLSAPVDPRE